MFIEKVKSVNYTPEVSNPQGASCFWTKFIQQLNVADFLYFKEIFCTFLRMTKCINLAQPSGLFLHVSTLIHEEVKIWSCCATHFRNTMVVTLLHNAAEGQKLSSDQI